VEKPRLFIGSARESMNYVTAMQEQLSYDFEVTPWTAGAFGAMEYTMESLQRQLDEHDYAAFIFSPDDLVQHRGHLVLAARDNTLFELGLFWGRLGRERVFCLIPDTVPDQMEGQKIDGFHLPSDMEGLNVLRYEVRTDRRNDQAAVNVACGKITAIGKELGRVQRIEQKLEEVIALSEVKDQLISFLTDLMGPEILHNRYESLYLAIRNAYRLDVLPGFSISQGAIWKVKDNEIFQVAGDAGKGRTYSLQYNEGKDEPEWARVVECHNRKAVQFNYHARIALKNVYLLCYPVSNRMVISLHLRGREDVSQADFARLTELNEELMGTVDYLYGGDEA